MEWRPSLSESEPAVSGHGNSPATQTETRASARRQWDATHMMSAPQSSWVIGFLGSMDLATEDPPHRAVCLGLQRFTALEDPPYRAVCLGLQGFTALDSPAG